LNKSNLESIIKLLKRFVTIFFIRRIKNDMIDAQNSDFRNHIGIFKDSRFLNNKTPIIFFIKIKVFS